MVICIHGFSWRRFKRGDISPLIADQKIIYQYRNEFDCGELWR
jgi:hypothetical protein